MQTMKGTLLLCLAVLAGQADFAQQTDIWPSRPITMVVPASAGSGIYLASAAGDYVVGHTLVVDGGVNNARG